MAQVRQRILALALGATLLAPAQAQKFYPDDPIAAVPKPLPVEKAKPRKLNEYYDFFWNTFAEPGQSTPEGTPVAGGAINTLGEVPDSSWYTNRHARGRMTLEELVRGSAVSGPPAGTVWQITAAKTEGVTPGFEIQDGNGVKYFFKFDPKTNPEMATAADVIGSKFFYAFGYNTPENYIVLFDRKHLKVSRKAMLRVETGHSRPMRDQDIDDILRRVPRDKAGKYRALASRVIPGAVIGPFRFNSTRSDDPNDIVPHENRRDLRGMRVFAAWMNHTDSKSLNSLDSIVEEGGVHFVKHFLIDFGAILGSDSLWAKSPRAGNVYLFAWKPAAAQFLTLGIYTPRWMLADYPHLPEVGRLESKVFNPLTWKPNYPNPAFDRCLPDDSFWAAKQVMEFTEEEIRAMVGTGQFSDPVAADYMTRTLIARRDKIGRAFFEQVLPLDRFRVRRGELEFEDLAVNYGFVPPRGYQVQWYSFDNRTERLSALNVGGPVMALADGASDTGGRGAHHVLAYPIPQASGEYIAAEIVSAGQNKRVRVYLQNRDRVVGVDRTW